MQLNVNTSKNDVAIGLYDHKGLLVSSDSWESDHNESEILIHNIEGGDDDAFYESL